MPDMVTARYAQHSLVGSGDTVIRHVLPPRSRLLGLVAALAIVAACGGGGGPSTPTGSPGTSQPVGGSPSAPGGTTDTPGAIGTPFIPPWPVGWDTAFCAAFGDMIVMQEVAVDIGRALEDDARDDARALAAELALTAADVREQLGALPPWEAAAALETQIVALLDLADEMAARYERYFDSNRRKALNAAREAGGQMNDVVPELLDRAIVLADAGLGCPGLDFDLETPPRP